MKYAIQENEKIRVFDNLPKHWRNVINFNKLSEKDLNKLGFYKVIEPVIDDPLHYGYGDLQFDETLNAFEYEIVEMSHDEIEHQMEMQFEQFMHKKLSDGQSYYNEKSKEITMQLFGRPQNIVNPIVIEIDNSVTPILDKVRTGDWYSALLLQLPQPTIQEVVDILNEVKSDIQNYVQENYH